MNPKLYFLSLLLALLTFASISFSFGQDQKDPLAIASHQAYGHHNPREYPTSLTAINRQNDRNNELEFPSSHRSRIDHNTHGLMTRFSRTTRSRSSSSPQIFNVDDFGARGDGRDDTQVFCSTCSYLSLFLCFLYLVVLST